MFEDLIYQNMRQVGANSSSDTQLPTGAAAGDGRAAGGHVASVHAGQPAADQQQFRHGDQRPWLFQLQMPDGTTGYTRDGSFHPDAQGQLVNANGIPLSPPISVPQGTRDITIANDGTVTVSIAGQDGVTQIGQIQLATFQNAAGLGSAGAECVQGNGCVGCAHGLHAGHERCRHDPAGLSGNVECERGGGAGVDDPDQRAYEINSKAIQTSDQMLARISQL